jgi:outer membrane murein-binding lipoprotein Lpp
VTARRIVAASACVAALALGGVACSDSTKDSSGATTNLDEVGAQIAKLRLEVHQLRQEVQTLREDVAQVTPATDPSTGLAVDTTTTTAAPTTTTTTPTGDASATSTTKAPR